MTIFTWLVSIKMLLVSLILFKPAKTTTLSQNREQQERDLRALQSSIVTSSSWAPFKRLNLSAIIDKSSLRTCTTLRDLLNTGAAQKSGKNQQQ